jgi:aldose 1-epimerase
MPNKSNFQQTIGGIDVSLYQFKNSNNAQLSITNYGARIVSLLVPGKNGELIDVVVGFDSIENYLQATEVYHGATIGRYGNRIALGKFSIGSKEYQLPVNNPPNHLHGGPAGFHTKVWDVNSVDSNSIQLSYLSVDGEEGYPGNLQTTIRFTFTDENEVVIFYEATTDNPTILNLTNHAYFNLNGLGSGTIVNHQLQLNADHYTPVNETLIPTGSIDKVCNTPFDFTTPTAIGKKIKEKNQQLLFGNGYDHNMVLNKKGEGVQLAATAVGDVTGLQMEVYTDQPGVQFYTGNFMSGENLIKGHVPDHFRTAFCLETQHFPDSPNHSNFPSTVLNPGEQFQSTTIYKFTTPK